jgi:type I restriction enzyme S subunit
MSRIPNSWELVRLGDILQLNYGKGLPKKSREKGEFCVYGSNGIVDSHSSAIIAAPALIIGRKGSIGEVHIAKSPCWPIDTTYYIDEFYDQPIQYWFYQLKSLPLNQLNRASAIPGLNRDDAYNQKIPLPPLNEQRRIVAKIEELTDRTRKAREALEDVPQLIEQFRRSVLAAAFRGDLTADWREQNPNAEPAIESKFKGRETSFLPSSWSCVNIGSVIESLKYGTSQKCSYDIDGTPVLRIPNISEGRIDTSDLKYTLFEKKEYQKFQIQVGDILMIRSNGSVSLVGKSALVEKVEEDLAYAGYLIRLRPKRDRVSPEFLNLCLSSPGLRTQIEIPARSTSGVNNINSKEVQKLLIPLPPIKEQFAIVQKLQALDRYLESVQSEYLESHQQVNKLDRAILAKAFRGELVPQDPTDEPASQLLQRIRRDHEKTNPKQTPTAKRTARNSQPPYQTSLDL